MFPFLLLFLSISVAQFAGIWSIASKKKTNSTARTLATHHGSRAPSQGDISYQPIETATVLVDSCGAHQHSEAQVAGQRPFPSMPLDNSLKGEDLPILDHSSSSEPTQAIPLPGGLDSGSTEPSHASGAVTQVLKGTQVTGGHLSVAARDVHHHHIHYHRVASEVNVELPVILETVPNFRGIHIATLGKATKGTGEWIRIFDSWMIWLDAKGSLKILWGYGMPGAGKTILSSIVISALEEHAKASSYPVCVCYIYFRYSDHTNATLHSFLETLVKQTLERHPGCHSTFDGVYARHIREKTRPGEDELLELLRQFTDTMISFYILDALDEAPIKIQLEILEKLSGLRIKLFVTSRPMQSIQAVFPDAQCFPISAQDEDIDRHITQEISRSSDLRAILGGADLSLRNTIFATIKQKCGGMFLHASLQLVALQECDSIQEVEEALAAFPADIEELYLQTWQRILSQPKAKVLRAKHVFVWVLNATRSLTVEELRYAVATHPDTYKVEENRLVQEHALVGVCRGLVTVEEETQLVRLVHYTAKEVLNRLILECFPHPDTLLAAVCMGRLTECGIQHSTIDSEEELDQTLQDNPFLQYAYDAWSVHAQKSLRDPSGTARLAQFVQGSHSFPVRLDYSARFRETDLTFDSLDPLHVAAFFNLPISLAGSSSLEDPNIATPKEGLTPLHVACAHNSVTAVEELLRLPDILVNALTDNDNMGALSVAIMAKSEQVVLLLLAHPQIEVNAFDELQRTPLFLAVCTGHEGLIKILLSHPQVDVNAVNRGEMTALGRASQQSGSTGGTLEALVKLVLSHPQIQISDRELEQVRGRIGRCDNSAWAKKDIEIARRVLVLLEDARNSKGGTEDL